MTDFTGSKAVCIVLDEPVPDENGTVSIDAMIAGLPAFPKGFSVEVVILASPRLPPAARQLISATLGRSLGSTSFVDPAAYANHDVSRRERAASLALFRHLSEEGDYDLVLFWCPCSLAFYTLMARTQGTALTDTAIHLRPPVLSSWQTAEVTGLPTETRDLMLGFMEKEAIARADHLVLSSNYALDWLRGAGWTLPQGNRCQVIAPLPAAGKEDTDPADTEAISELILAVPEWTEICLRIAIDALNQLAPRLQGAGIKVTLAGAFQAEDFFYSGTMLAELARDWTFPLAIFPARPEEVLATRARAGALVVIPEPLPFDAAMALPVAARGVPVIVSDQGATAGLYAASAAAALCCKMTGAGLAAAIGAVLEGKPPAPVLADPVRAAGQDWATLLAEATSGAAREVSAKAAEPLVTLCVTHYNRPARLAEAVRQVRAQTYRNIEFLVVDDGSAGEGVQAALDELLPELARAGGRLIRRENGYLGAARNTGLAEAKGDYICFLDDDDLALPRMVERLVTAALNTGAEIVSGLQTPFPHSRREQAVQDVVGYPGLVSFFPLGGPLSLTLNDYCLANATSLISVAALRALGGYSELRNVGGEDHELYTRALQKGLRIEISPHTAYLYETGVPSMSTTNPYVKHMVRVLDSMMLERPELWRDTFRLVAGQRAIKKTKDVRCSMLLNNSHRDTLQKLFAAKGLEAQLGALIAYAGLLGNTAVAHALITSVAAQKKGAPPEHSALSREPGTDKGKDEDKAKAPELPTELATLAERLLRRLEAPSVAQDSLAMDIREVTGRDHSVAALRQLLKDAAGWPAAVQDDALTAEILFAISLRIGDLDMAFRLATRQAEIDNQDYLRRYPDVAGALPQGTFRSGLHHFVLWGRKESRWGFPRIATLSRILAVRTGKDVPIDRLKARLKRLQTENSGSDAGA